MGEQDVDTYDRDCDRHDDYIDGDQWTEEELDELVDFDGSVLGSKVPLGYMNNKTISQRKTTDAVVPATRQGGEQGKGYFYKRYWGESVEEVGEHAKGVETAEFKLKKKLMKAVYGIEIYLSKKNNTNFLKIPLT